MQNTVIHEIPAVWDGESRILMLGTMPSPASREAGFFYMHPRNRFWQVLPAVFGEKLKFPNSVAEKEAAIAERRSFLLKHNIALWDVLSSCEILGAQDSSIQNAVPNDFTERLRGWRFFCVFYFLGKCNKINCCNSYIGKSINGKTSCKKLRADKRRIFGK